MRTVGFASSYRGTPPWDIGRPQSAVVALAARGVFEGRVLDVGCGTGENTLHLASRGCTVLGIDGASVAVDRARVKAEQRGLIAEFAVADALDLAALGRQFDVVLDSAFLHTLGDHDTRRAYVRQIACVLPAGGWTHLLEISELATGEFPSLTRAEITDAFGDGWSVPEVSAAVYAVTTGEVPAWLVSARREKAMRSNP